MMLILILAGIGLFAFRLDRKGPEQNADRQTAAALAQAKEALLGYAASDGNLPGSIPCPDANNDGTSDLTDYSGPNCVAPVGRLPWQLLRLQDLRDGSGERLWYAVSPNFNANTSTALNSSLPGQITIRDQGGSVVYDASAGNGVVAVIIAPGAVLVRQGAPSPQNRTCIMGATCDSQSVCTVPTGTSFTSVPLCNPVNYLDVTTSEDNQNFQPDNLDGFILGVIKSVSGQLIVNDRILVITTNDLFSVVQKRIFAEIKGTSTTALLGYYQANSAFPWAASASGAHQTPNSLKGFAPTADLTFPMRCSKPSCDQGKMLDNNGWNTATFYEVAPAFAPGGPQSCSLANCLTVNGKSNAKVRITIGSTQYGIW